MMTNRQLYTALYELQDDMCDRYYECSGCPFDHKNNWDDPDDTMCILTAAMNGLVYLDPKGVTKKQVTNDDEHRETADA